MIKIAYLIIGLAFTFGIPLGMLQLAILYAGYQEKLTQKEIPCRKKKNKI